MNPAPDWTPVQPFPFSGARRTFTSPVGEDAPIGIRYYKRPDGALVALAGFGPRAEGPPNHVHGGAILTVLDEVLGAAAWMAGHPVLTARLNAQFRHPVHLGTTFVVEPRIVDARHGLVRVRGELRDETKIYAEAQGVFMRLEKNIIDQSAE